MMRTNDDRVFCRTVGAGPHARRACLLLCLLLVNLIWLPPSTALACWDGIDAGMYAYRCPVIVTGKIVRITEYEPADDDAERARLQFTGNRAEERAARVYDTAHIEIRAVHKNALTDVPLDVGDEIAVRMNSRRDMRVSTDLRYPVGTDAVWLVFLASDGAFYINERPEQKQALDTAGNWDDPDPQLPSAEAGWFMTDQDQVIALGPGEPPAITRDRWAGRIEEIEQKEYEEHRRRAERTELARRLFQEAFVDGAPNEAGFAAILDAEQAVRFLVTGYIRHRTGPDAAGRRALAEYLAEHDPDEQVRRAAQQYLGRSTVVQESDAEQVTSDEAEDD